jgi:hypothetical protein
MAAAGDYLGVHGATLWNTNTLDEVAAQIAALSGLSDGKHGAWPQGNFGLGTDCEAIIAAAKSAGLKTIRAAGGNGIFLPGYTEWGAFPSYPLDNTLSLAQAKAAVDRAETGGGVCVFYGHKFGAVADSVTWVTGDYTALLDYIAQKRTNNRCDATTIAPLYNEALGL